ncbi:phage tail spike protein [Alkalibacter mobilis]|uniref:phage tail spike protein n=1 Tax=Alkalibacter mobilis TaxID=2787712 RepID=UPI00189F75FF|nr:phage tail spike protein [Alkalibacter mobilis]MBF7097573.1 phage tail protein [Alkalibacter mobilis]
MALIKIFDTDDKIYTSNGNLAIQPLKCIETKYEGFNGWEVDIELPVDYKEYIAQDSIVVVPTKSKGEQPFRVQNPEVTTRLVRFKATHVAFDASRYLIEDVYPQNLNGASFMDWLNTRTDRISPFTTLSDVSTLGTARIIRKTLMEAFLIAQERLGGFFDFDKWQIRLLSSLGLDRGETIRYGKNLQGIRVYENWNDVCTKILPVGPDGITLPEVYLISDVQYSEVYAKAVNFNIQSEEGETLSEEDITSRLRTMAQAHLDVYKYPKIRFEISADVNQDLDIGDIVYVVTKQAEVPTQVQGYVYDVNRARVTKLIYGNFNNNAKSIFSTIKANIEQALVSGADANKLVSDQSNIIDQLGKIGHVYQDDNEIMVLDALPKESAQNVLRINIGGIGFSSTGIEGPFTSAWTLDGAFNATFIQTGILNANLIKTGTLQSENGVSYINMNDGSFNLGSDNIVYDGENLTIRLNSGTTMDEIATKVDNSESLINQTADDIRTEVSANYTTQNEFASYQNEVSTQFTQTQDTFNFQFTNLESLVNEIDGGSQEQLEEIHRYIRFVDGNIELGEADNPIILVIENDVISFKQNGISVAYFANNILYVTDANFLNSIRIGNFAFTPRENGNLSFGKVV